MGLPPWFNLFSGANLYRFNIEGSFDDRPVGSSGWVYSINSNFTFKLPSRITCQLAVNYLSERVTAQGEDSRFFSPNLTVRKTSKDGRFSATVQWLNLDLGMWEANEQRISTWRAGEFFTTTNYVYEVDVVMLNLSYSLNQKKNKAKFIKSEFGEKEF